MGYEDEQWLQDEDLAEEHQILPQILERRRGKIKEADFTPCTRRIALMGKEAVRKSISIGELFPDEKEEYYWRSMSGEVMDLPPSNRHNHILRDALMRARANQGTRDKLVTFVSAISFIYI